MGGDRVRAHLWRLPVARRPGRGSPWSPPDADDRTGRIHRGLARLRARDRRCVPDREPRGAGCGRSDHAARRPLDRHEHVPRGPRAEQGARDLGRTRRRRGDRRADRRRRAHPLRRLAVHLLSERADRGGGAGARTAGRPREPAGHHSPPVRRARRDRRDGRPRPPRRRDLASASVRLGRDQDDRAPRRIGRPCSPRSW